MIRTSRCRRLLLVMATAAACTAAFLLVIHPSPLERSARPLPAAANSAKDPPVAPPGCRLRHGKCRCDHTSPANGHTVSDHPGCSNKIHAAKPAVVVGLDYSFPSKGIALPSSGEYTCPRSRCTLVPFGEEAQSGIIEVPESTDAVLSASEDRAFVRRNGFQRVILVSSGLLNGTQVTRTGDELRARGYTEIMSSSSAVAFPTWPLAPITEDLSDLQAAAVRSWDLRRQAVVAIMPDCGIPGPAATMHSRRIRQLVAAGIPVHVYGGCHATHTIESEVPLCVRDIHEDPSSQVGCILSAYRAVLLPDGEMLQSQLWHAVGSGIVPIIAARDAPATVSILPAGRAEHAAVYLPEEMDNATSRQLVALLSSKDAWLSYHSWRPADWHALPHLAGVVEQSLGNLACYTCDRVVLGQRPGFCRWHVIQEIPEANVSLMILGTESHPRDNELHFLAFVERFDGDAGPNRVQALPYAQARDWQFQLSVVGDTSNSATACVLVNDGDVQRLKCKMPPLPDIAIRRSSPVPPRHQLAGRVNQEPVRPTTRADVFVGPPPSPRNGRCCGVYGNPVR